MDRLIAPDSVEHDLLQYKQLSCPEYQQRIPSAVHHQHGHFRMADHFLCGAAERGMDQIAFTMPAHDEQVGIQYPACFQNLLEVNIVIEPLHRVIYIMSG